MLKERENIIVSATEPTGKNREKVWIQKGKNLFNKNNANIISGYLSANTQKIYKNSTYIDKMLYIKCRPNTTYTISKKQSSRFSTCTADEIITTAEKNISNATTNNTSTSITITSGANDNYLYVFYYTQGDNESSILDSIQIEQNSSVTSYETYIEPKIHVLNDNNVYEEFVQKQQNDYSTEEQIIGKWVDGKNIYRRVLLEQNVVEGSNLFLISNYMSTLVNYQVNTRRQLSNNRVQTISNSLYTDANNYQVTTPNSKNLEVYIKGYDGIENTTIIVEYTKTTD